jgi:hypothetical protein
VSSGFVSDISGPEELFCFKLEAVSWYRVHDSVDDCVRSCG